jgi:outer membrane protein assembly factor BamB
MRRALLVTLALLPVSTHAGPAGDWPQFRGPNRDGIAAEPAESRLLTQWPESGPPVLWRARGGKGYSGIVVSGGRAYTQWAEGEGEGAQEYVVALDAATGKEVWRFRSDRAFVNPEGDGPRSTPAVDGDRLFAVSGRGKLLALDKNTGKLLWQHDLVTFGGSTGSGGSGSFCSSPLIDGDRLFVEIGGAEEPETGSAGKPEAGALPSFGELTGLQTGSAAPARPTGPKTGSAFAAFDKATGKPLWMTESDLGGFSAPLAFTAAGVRQVVFFSSAGLVSLSPQDGRIFWRYPWENAINAASPLVLPGDRLFVSSGDDVGAAVLQMKADGQGGVGVQTVWKNRSMMNLYYSSVLVGGNLYGFHRTTLKCLDPATGEERWKHNNFSLGSVIAAGDHLVLLYDTGTLGLAEANPKEFKLVAKAKVLEGKTLTAPALADGRVYLRNNTDEIVCVDLTEKS